MQCRGVVRRSNITTYYTACHVKRDTRIGFVAFLCVSFLTARCRRARRRNNNNSHTLAGNCNIMRLECCCRPYVICRKLLPLFHKQWWWHINHRYCHTTTTRCTIMCLELRCISPIKDAASPSSDNPICAVKEDSAKKRVIAESIRSLSKNASYCWNRL